MADTLTTKKVTDLTGNSTVSDEDLFMVGNAGTAVLRKVKWSKILEAILEAIKAKILEWAFEKLSTTDKTISGAINELNTKTLQNKGNVSNALTETCNYGWYTYSYNTTDAPSTDAGVIITLPLSTVLAFRLAITSSGKLYTSVYIPGQSYGTWGEK